MWQKELKQLKKLMPEQFKVSQKIHEAKNKPEPTIDFADYCKELNIKPISQDTANIKPPVKKQSNRQIIQIKQATFNNDFEFVDINDAPKEFFRFGQRLLPKQLRESNTYIHRTIDTHNLTRSNAVQLIETIIHNAEAGTIIRIIHGMGNNSEFNQPVLMGTIRKYLSMSQRVLAFSYGSIAQGGNGVTIVKLSK